MYEIRNMEMEPKYQNRMAKSLNQRKCILKKYFKSIQIKLFHYKYFQNTLASINDNAQGSNVNSNTVQFK